MQKLFTDSVIKHEKTVYSLEMVYVPELHFYDNSEFLGELKYFQPLF